MRFGDYEILVSNRWCYQIYRVLPPVTASGEQRRAKLMKAGDGSLLSPIECYPSTLALALRRVAEFAEKDAASAGDAEEVAGALERLHAEIAGAAARLEAAEAAGRG